LRIGFIISGTLDTLTGGYIYDRQLVDYLRQNGHYVELIHLPGGDYFNRLLHSPRLVLSHALDHLSLDILLQDELDHPSLILINHKLKRRAGYPIISIVHNLRSCELRPAWQNQLYRCIEKQYLMSVDGFIFNSHTTRRAVEGLQGKPQTGIIALPCGNRLPADVTESDVQARARASGPLRILFLGNLLRGKGLHILLDAVSALPENSYFLTVIGDSSMDKSYVGFIKNEIREKHLDDQVLLTGSINNYELAVKLKENHVLAVPSYYEGFGIAFLEGMGFGLPSIGTTSGAAGEIITHGQNGFLIPAGDSQALSWYLNELNTDRHKLMLMGIHALQRFNSHPTWQMSCEKILDFLLYFKPSS
jgi:glycosyltransferase involved in cell wall biosynthesis